MWQEANRHREVLRTLAVCTSAIIASLLLMAELYVHPHRGIAIKVLRDDLPFELGRFVGNSTTSALVITSAIAIQGSLRAIDTPVTNLIADHTLKAGIALMIFLNCDIELATAQRMGQGVKDAGVGIVTGLATAEALIGHGAGPNYAAHSVKSMHVHTPNYHYRPHS